MTNETTLEKIQGARTVRDMILWARLTQREITELEAAMGRAADRNWHYNGARYGELGVRWDIDHDIAEVKRGATDAGIHVWRHGPAELNHDPNPVFNHWQPDVSEREA